MSSALRWKRKEPSGEKIDDSLRRRNKAEDDYHTAQDADSRKHVSRRQRSRSKSPPSKSTDEFYGRSRKNENLRGGEGRNKKLTRDPEGGEKHPDGSKAPSVANIAPGIVARGSVIEVICNDRLGKKIRVKCSPDDTVGDFKKLLAAQTGTTSSKLVLKKWYTTFKDHVTLSDYEIHNGMSLEMYYS